MSHPPSRTPIQSHYHPHPHSRMYNATTMHEYVDNAVNLAHAHKYMFIHDQKGSNNITNTNSMNWFQCRNTSHMLAIDNTVIKEWYQFLQNVMKI